MKVTDFIRKKTRKLCVFVQKLLKHQILDCKLMMMMINTAMFNEMNGICKISLKFV